MGMTVSTQVTSDVHLIFLAGAHLTFFSLESGLLVRCLLGPLTFYAVFFFVQVRKWLFWDLIAFLQGIGRICWTLYLHLQCFRLHPGGIHTHKSSYPQVSIIHNLSWLERSERSLLIGAALASFIQPLAFLTLDYILVIMVIIMRVMMNRLLVETLTRRRPLYDVQMWRDIVPMLTPGSFVRFYSSTPFFIHI